MCLAATYLIPALWLAWIGYWRVSVAYDEYDMNLPGWRWHSLTGDMSGHWAVWVDKNWRLTFAFEGPDAVFVDYRDYH